MTEAIYLEVSEKTEAAKKERMYNRNVSAMVQRISRSIETAADEEEIFQIITTFYQEYGVGMFGLNKAFRIRSCENGDVEFLPINNMDSVVLDDLIGYQMQKDMLREIRCTIAETFLLYMRSFLATAL